MNGQEHWTVKHNVDIGCRLDDLRATFKQIVKKNEYDLLAQSPKKTFKTLEINLNDLDLRQSLKSPTVTSNLAPEFEAISTCMTPKVGPLSPKQFILNNSGTTKQAIRNMIDEKMAW